MIVRKIRPEEVKRTEELFSICFNSSYYNENTPEHLYHKYVTNPQNREQEHCLERFAVFEDDDKTMMSCIVMQPFHVNYHTHSEPMLSIGGVATLPQYRKHGGMGACFQAVLPYMYQKGIVFSYLYPFSTKYYNKFGYELCCKRHLYHIALPYIPAYKISGSCYLLDSATVSQASKDIPYIYEKWQSQYNMMVVNNHYDYRFIESADPYKDQTFTYIYRSSAGTPLAYMTFKCNVNSRQNKLECTRFFYINIEGLQGLLTLAKSFSNDYSHICFSLPPDQILEPILPEWSMGAVNCELIPHGMVRVIQVQKVLQDSLYIGDGKLTIKIIDNYIKENNKIFQVTFENNHCIDILQVHSDPDITMPISAFSGFIAGTYKTDSLSLFEDVVIHKHTKDLRKVFYKKPLYITSSF